MFLNLCWKVPVLHISVTKPAVLWTSRHGENFHHSCCSQGAVWVQISSFLQATLSNKTYFWLAAVHPYVCCKKKKKTWVMRIFLLQNRIHLPMAGPSSFTQNFSFLKSTRKQVTYSLKPSCWYVAVLRGYFLQIKLDYPYYWFMHELMPLLNDVHVLGSKDHSLQFIRYTGQYSHEFTVYYTYIQILQTYENETVWHN